MEKEEKEDPNAASPAVEVEPVRDDSGTMVAHILHNWYLTSDGEIKGKVHRHPRRDDSSGVLLEVENSVNREELKTGSTIHSTRGTPYLLGDPKPSKSKKKDAKRKKEKKSKSKKKDARRRKEKEELLKTVAEEAG